MSLDLFYRGTVPSKIPLFYYWRILTRQRNTDGYILTYTDLKIIFSDNISAIKSYVLSIHCLESELVVPDMRMNHSTNRSNGFAKRSKMVCNSVWVIRIVHLHTGMFAVEKGNKKRARDEVDVYLQSIVGNWTCKCPPLFVKDEAALYCTCSLWTSLSQR